MPPRPAAHADVHRTLGLVIPLSAGLVVFGWRSAALVALVLGGSLAAALAWRRVGGRRGESITLRRSAWLALLLAAMLPAHLAGGSAEASGGCGGWLWPAPVAAGMLAVVVDWLVGGSSARRVQPVLIAYLTTYVLIGPDLVPHAAVRAERAVTGDLLDVDPATVVRPTDAGPDDVPWFAAERLGPTFPHDAVWSDPPTQRLTFYTSGTAAPERGALSIDSVLRDRMPPLEDLVIGGQPAPVGQASAVATIFGGLFLIYRRVTDWRVPAVALATGYAALAVLPVPVTIGPDGAAFRWLAGDLPGVGWAAGLTLAHYGLFAGPALFVALFLAPMSPRVPGSLGGKVAYSAFVGVVGAALSLYVSAAIGPYLALLVAGVLGPTATPESRPPVSSPRP